MVHIDVGMLLLAHLVRAAVGIGGGKEGGGRLLRLVVRLLARRRHIKDIVELVLLRRGVVVDAATDQLQYAVARIPSHAPAPVVVSHLRVADVVDVADDTQPHVVLIILCKKFSLVLRLLPWRRRPLGWSAAKLHVCHPPLVVLLFQRHVEGVRLLDAHRVAVPVHIGIVVLLLIHLQPLHHICRQVLESHLRVAVEEVLAIDVEILQPLAVVVDLPAILDFHAWQHRHKLVEHAALRELEIVGIEDHGVALVDHHDFRSAHGGLAQLLLHLSIHEHIRRLPFLRAAAIGLGRNANRHQLHRIALARASQQIFSGERAHRIFYMRAHVGMRAFQIFLIPFVVVQRQVAARVGPDHRRVRQREEFHAHFIEVVERIGIAHIARERQTVRRRCSEDNGCGRKKAEDAEQHPAQGAELGGRTCHKLFLF